MGKLAITVRQPDISRHVAFARDHDVGLEIQAFGYDPSLLDGDWPVLVAQQKVSLRGFEGEIALHGAFYDMVSASPDARVVALARERFLSNLHIAGELGAHHVVFHANYFPLISHPSYLPDWTERQVDFWIDLAEAARRLGLVIVLENMWEPDPGIIGRVLEQVDSPHLGACLDVGHVHLYSLDTIPLSAWLERLGERLVHCHINNHHGQHDEHLPLDAEDGIVDYQAVLPLIWALPQCPLISLEMNGLESLERSLDFVKALNLTA